MDQILVYGDSLTWGIIPNTRQRLSFEQRWPGVLERELTGSGRNVRIIEDCLNGRRTVWDDPYKPGRNGLIGIEQRIEINSPLALVILMLGTNDFQSLHQNNAWQSAQGIAALIRAVRRAPIEPGMPVPPVLVVAPPPMREASGPIAPKFTDAHVKSRGLAEAYEQVSVELDCAFFDAGRVTSSSKVDGIHLDVDQHETLGRELARMVAGILKTD
jgi:lysophospholipase L1-like esterase